MKKLIKVASIGLMALAIAGVQINLHAQEGDAPPVEKKEKSARPLPFHGKIKAVDKKAKTVTVGSRTFNFTPDTKFLQGSMDTAKVGEEVGGSYWKAADGTLTLNSIRIGPKKDKPAAE